MEDNTLAHLNGSLLDGLKFCAETYAVFERIRREPDGPNRLRLRASPVEKRLLEELLPICRYVQTYYRAGRYISVRWVDGSQSFDAELRQQGDYVDEGYYPAVAYLEATSAMHENEHWIWKLLSQGKGAFAPEGISKPRREPVRSEPVVFTNMEHVERFVPIVLAQVAKKAEISYPPDTSLVIQCSLNTLYTSDDWRLLAEETRRQLPEHPFQEILLFDGITQMTARLA
ncbi:MAG TPA: hypothetical protein VGJ72_05835 [Polaromonas sp.]|jgi:hypothetical protein